MKLEVLEQHVQSAAAIRYRARLQPAGGKGDKVFPPTYESGKYAEETRRIDGANVPCVSSGRPQGRRGGLSGAET